MRAFILSIVGLGIDIGSTASKCIMLEDGKEIVAKSLIDVGAGTSGPQRAIDRVLQEAGKARGIWWKGQMEAGF